MRYGKCFLCGYTLPVEQHHIFRCVGGASRTKSDKLGLTVDLCHGCHQASPTSAHRCAETDRKLKRYGQRKAMIEQGWDKNTFIQEFGRNYLDEDDLAVIREMQEMDRALTEEELEQELGAPEWTREEIDVDPETIRGLRITLEVMPF